MDLSTKDSTVFITWMLMGMVLVTLPINKSHVHNLRAMSQMVTIATIVKSQPIRLPVKSATPLTTTAMDRSMKGFNADYYLDADGDGFGDPTTLQVSCAPIASHVTNGDDCNDAEATANPVATEICDTIDNNCDGLVNEGLDATYYIDTDADGYGNASVSQIACTQPQGYVSNPDDCNDSSAAASPVATEICDGIDNDCNGATDEAVELTFYLDYDQDGFGDPNQPYNGCSQPQFYTTNDLDCDDTSVFSFPNASEICDTLDNICDGTVDESFTTNGLYIDIDNCGTCGNDCSGLTFDNANPICDAYY